MKEEIFDKAREYFDEMEQQIALLPKEHQGTVFRKCAINCVSNGVLPFLRARCERCGGDLDLFFSEQENSEYAFQRVIEKGHVYEMGYPRCLCFMHDMKFAKSEVHCECSRQSILFVLHELFSDRTFEVETMGTVLSGCDECTFRVTSDKLRNSQTND